MMFMIVPLEIRLGDDAGEVCDVGADAEFGEFIRHGAFGGEIGAEFDKLHGAAGGVGDDVGETEFADAGFAALDRGDDAHHTDLRINESLHRFTHPWRVGRTESPGNGRVGDRGDMILAPCPRWPAIRRTPCIAPDSSEFFGCCHKRRRS